ncbi:serine hydrolase domain-containing protein [Actinophytocola xanthii]|uniref:Beta-lactamase-related domain-containing protein n=1 Tax=Actinophytocola xanthii TaxID=1912961 RepID=A0A1Q8C917_9PSEU|nr:serine hydrolase domain-containing protein [Actinophytocola xanthii]OLF10850.1 hypothetical protein BU204_31075 [Actinophytocola xanthii]
MQTVHRRRSILALLGATGLATTTGGIARAGGRDRLPRDLLPGGRLDLFVAERAAADQFSGTVLVAHRGRPVLTRSHGLADKAAGIPNTADTGVDLASMTKSFTGVALTHLAEQGALAFHEPLGAFLDGFPSDVAAVTLHQLATHTAGAGRSALTTQRPPGEAEWGSEEEVWQGMLAYLRTLPLRFTPGTAFGYGNDGYFLLGAVVAAVSGLSYYDYVRQHVFAPAGLTHTEFHTRPQVLAATGVAHPYATQPNGERVDMAPSLPYIGAPSHGAFCSARDLLRFAHALHTNGLLGPAYTRVVTGGKHALSPADRPAPAGQREFYGYGHVETVAGEHRIVGHSGGGPGRATNLDVFPETGWTVVVLSNYDTTIRPIVDLARQLVMSAAGRSATLPVGG